MGLLDFLSGGGGNSGAAPDLYAGALLPEQMAAIRQRSLGGAMAGLLKSGALDYTVPFISGKVPGGFAAGLAGAAAGAQDAQDQSANVGLKAQEFLLNKQMLKQKLGLLQQLMGASGGDDGMSAAFGASGGAPPPEAGGQGGGQTAGAPSGAPDLSQPGQGDDPRGLVPYIRLTATKYGIDPNVATAVAGSEGLGTFLGDHGKSGGAFQLYTGGGLGNEFQKETGLNPLDPKNERATIDFALRKAAEGGWGPWNGAKRLGITGFAGIGKFAPPQGQGPALAGGASAPSFDTGPVNGLQAPQPPIRLAQNGAPTSIPMLPAGDSSGSAMPPDPASVLARGSGLNLPPGRQYLPTTASGDVAPSAVDPAQYQARLTLSQAYGRALDSGFKGTIQDFVAQNGQSSGGQPSPGATPMPQIANGTNAPPPPPAAMPPGLIPGAGAAPPPSGIPPVTQPQPAAQQQGAAPAQMPAVPSAALTPAQLAYAQRQQNLSKAYALLGIKTPGFLDEAAGLPFVGPKAAATAGAQYPYEIGKQTNQADLQLRNKRLEPQIMRQGGSLWAMNPATGKYELQAQSPRLPEGTSLVNTPQGPVAQEVPGAIPAIQSASRAQKSGGYEAEYGGMPGFNQGAPNPAEAPTSKVQAIPTPQGTMLPPISQQFMPQSPAEIQEALPKWHAQTEKWTEAIAPARQAEMRLSTIANAFKMTESGAFETHKAELAATLKALGMDPGLVMSTNPAAVQEALHDNMLTTLPLLKAATPRPSQIEFLSVSENREHPNIQPAANLKMLSEDLALVRQAQQLPADWNVAQQQGWRNPQSFETAWSALNPLDKARDQAERDIGPLRGMLGGPGSPPPPSGAVKALQMNPMLRDQFEAKYGPGTAAKVLGK